MVFDVVVRLTAGTILLVVAGLLVRDAEAGTGRRQALFFAAFALGACGFLAGNTPDAGLMVPGVAGAVLYQLSGTAALSLWLFGLVLFDGDFRLAPPHVIVGGIWLMLAGVDRGLAGPVLAAMELSWLLVAIGIGMVGHLCWRLARDRDGDLIGPRREARLVLVGVLALLLLTDLLIDLTFGLAWRPLGLTSAQNGAILLVAAWLASLLLAAGAAPLTIGASAASTRRPPSTAPPGSSDDPLVERLHSLVTTERVYLDPDVTVAGFARLMGASEPVTRRLINEELGHGHFRGFLNAYRVEEAKRRLADPARSGEKIASIALDSGFASLASFNRAFRAAEDRTPSAYRAEASGCVARGDVASSEERSRAF